MPPPTLPTPPPELPEDSLEYEPPSTSQPVEDDTVTPTVPDEQNGDDGVHSKQVDDDDDDDADGCVLEENPLGNDVSDGCILEDNDVDDDEGDCLLEENKDTECLIEENRG